MRWYRALALAATASALFILPAAGQRAAAARGAKVPPPPPPTEQLPPKRPEQSPQERQRLIQAINRQLMNQARNRLGLSSDQFPRFQRIVSGHALIRSGLQGEEHRTEFALREQLRLGAAGNQDSMSRLLTSLNAIRSRIAATDADESRDLEPVLNPAQRAQWQVMRDRFAQQVRAAAAQRPAGGPD